MVDPNFIDGVAAACTRYGVTWAKVAMAAPPAPAVAPPPPAPVSPVGPSAVPGVGHAVKQFGANQLAHGKNLLTGLGGLGSQQGRSIAWDATKGLVPSLTGLAGAGLLMHHHNANKEKEQQQRMMMGM